jgi:glutathione S-transferase
MYTLYWHPWSSSYAPMATMKELGVEFELYEVDYDGGETRTDRYRRIQPLGLIPALRLPDGRSMFESAAMMIYLCDYHRDNGLAPKIDAPDRSEFLQWMLFLADTIYPSYNRYYHPERYTADTDGADALKRRALEQAVEQFGVVEDALCKNGPWLTGERFSACDIYLQMITTWHEPPQELFERFHRVRELARLVTRREACQWAIERHNFATGFE